MATVQARIGWKALTADEYEDDGYAFLATPNIKSRTIDFDNVNYIKEFRYEESPELKLQVGDVLLAKDGSTLGIANCVRELPRPSTVNGSIAVLRPFEADPMFLTYWLQGAVIQARIQQLKDGMGVPHLFQQDIRKLPVPQVGDEEQRRIADFLDDRVARIDRIIAARREQAISITRALTSAVESEGAGKSRVPLRRFLESVKTGGTPDESANLVGGLSWYAPGSFGEHLDLSDPVREVGQDAVVHFPANTVLIVGIGATVGKVAWLDKVASGNQQLTCLVPRSMVMTGRFLLHQLNSRRDELRRSAPASTLPILNNEVLKAFGVWCPGMTQQATLTRDWDAALFENRRRGDALSRSIELLTEYKQSLITAAVTGELDVTTAGSGIPA